MLLFIILIIFLFEKIFVEDNLGKRRYDPCYYNLSSSRRKHSYFYY